MHDMKTSYRTTPRYEKAAISALTPELRRYAEKVTMPGASLFLWGPVGTGKTYALHGMARYLMEERGAPAHVFNFADTLRETRADFDRPYAEKCRADEWLRTFKGVAMIDDIGAEKPSEWVLEVLYAIVNYRYERKLPTVFTSNIGMADIGVVYGDRIASRIVEMCGGSDGIVKLTGQDRRTI